MSGLHSSYVHIAVAKFSFSGYDVFTITTENTDMDGFITYSSNNAPEGERWIAYALLPSGERWEVRFHGATEEEACERAKARLASEQSKVRPARPAPKAPVEGVKVAATGDIPVTEGQPKPYIHKPTGKWVIFAKFNGKSKYAGSYTSAEAAIEGRAAKLKEWLA